MKELTKEELNQIILDIDQMYECYNEDLDEFMCY